MQLEGQQLGHYRSLKLIEDNDNDIDQVYSADDMHISRQVAIRVFPLGGGSDLNDGKLQEKFSCFEREVGSVAKLDHPSILPLLDSETRKQNGGALAYLVTPFREEGSLANWLDEQGGKLLLKDVIKFVCQAAAALHYAHHHGIVHGNLKPSNCFIHYSKILPDATDPPPSELQSPDFQLTCFGVASLRTLFSGSNQSSSRYMAPEQWSDGASSQTDQYAIAAIAYELLTGTPPFDGTPEEMKEQKLHEKQPPPLSAHDSRLSSALDAVLQRALKNKPDERFPNIDEFANAFREAGEKKDKTISSSRWASFLLMYSFMTIILAFGIGIVLNALGMLPPFVTNVASGLGGYLLIFSGAFGAVTTKIIPNVWKNLNKLLAVLAVSLSLITAVGLAAGALHLSALTDPYTHQGRFLFEDSLMDNSRGNNWYVFSKNSTGGLCIFKDEGYYASQNEEPFNDVCLSQTQNFGDFIYEVQVRIIQGGCGGIIFRENTGDANSYHFYICRGESYAGRYAFDVHVNGHPKPPAPSSGRASTIIKTGLGQSNLIAVVAHGSSFSFYVNGKLLVSNVSDSTLTNGHIGVFASTATTAVFSDARLWLL
jgi:serine/threonine protein kinase